MQNTTNMQWEWNYKAIGNLFIWHGQIWKCGYLSQNKELTLISFPLILSLSSFSFLPFSFFLAFFKTKVKRGTKTKTQSHHRIRGHKGLRQELGN